MVGLPALHHDYAGTLFNIIYLITTLFLFFGGRGIIICKVDETVKGYYFIHSIFNASFIIQRRPVTLLELLKF